MKSFCMPGILVASVIAGCGDQRIVEISREAANRQAQQNKVVEKLADEQARARSEVARLQHGLQKERSYLNKLWTALDTERRQIAGDRRTESMLTTAARGMGLVLLAVAAIGFAAMAIFGLRHEQDDPRELLDLMVRRVIPSSGLHLDNYPPQEQIEHEKKEQVNK